MISIDIHYRADLTAKMPIIKPAEKHTTTTQKQYRDTRTKGETDKTIKICQEKRYTISGTKTLTPENIDKLYINKIQQDATVCRYLFTAKSLYMFRMSIAPIIRST